MGSICWLDHGSRSCSKPSAEAKSLDIPLFGTDTRGAFWGGKTGNRQVFRVAGPDGEGGWGKRARNEWDFDGAYGLYFIYIYMSVCVYVSIYVYT